MIVDGKPTGFLARRVEGEVRQSADDEADDRKGSKRVSAMLKASVGNTGALGWVHLNLPDFKLLNLRSLRLIRGATPTGLIRVARPAKQSIVTKSFLSGSLSRQSPR